MKKKLIIFYVLFVFCLSFLFSSSKEKQELYIKAVAEKDYQSKVELLLKYEELYGNKKDNYLKYVYIQLTDAFLHTKNYPKAITYGEKALEFQEISEPNKLTIYNSLANSYYLSKTDLKKAFEYADWVLKISHQVIENTKNSNIEKDKLEGIVNSHKKYYIAPTYRLQAKILYAMDKQNVEKLKEAASKAVKAYSIDQSDNSYRMVFSLAGELFKYNQIDDALLFAEQIFDENNTNERFAAFLATLHSKKGNKSKAVYYFEIAYNKKKNFKTAVNIGQLVYNKDIDKGIQYFADAFILSKLDKNSKAYKFLKHLYYNKKAKGLPSKEQDKGFNEIIQDAKNRIDVEPISEERYLVE